VADDATAYAFTEDGTARPLVDLILGRALFVPELGGAIFYDAAKGIWRRCDLVPACVRYVAEVINALPITDAEEVKARWKHVAKLLTAQGVRAVESTGPVTSCPASWSLRQYSSAAGTVSCPVERPTVRRPCSSYVR
jgi:hypothetical protein